MFEDFTPFDDFDEQYNSMDMWHQKSYDYMNAQMDKWKNEQEARAEQERRKAEALEEKNRIAQRKLFYEGIEGVGGLMSDIGSSMSDLTYTGVGKFSF